MSAATPDSTGLSFDRLVTAIGQAHAELAGQAARAVNSSLTLRNWLIGFYIAEYEQQGTDRARYADRLIERLSERLIQAGISRSDARELRRYRSFYLTYPQIRESLTPELQRGLLGLLPQVHPGGIRPPQLANLGVAPGEILSKLSFTHIAELLQCDDPTKRAFYEQECIRGNWSVRELKRQMASLYYERSGLSRDKLRWRPERKQVPSRRHRPWPFVTRTSSSLGLEAAGGHGRIASRRPAARQAACLLA